MGHERSGLERFLAPDAAQSLRDAPHAPRRV